MEPKDPMEPVEPTSLRTTIRQTLTTTHTDQELAAALLASGALIEALESSTLTAPEAAALLGIERDSVRKLAGKSKTFPSAVVSERRYSEQQIRAYRAQRN